MFAINHKLEITSQWAGVLSGGIAAAVALGTVLIWLWRLEAAPAATTELVDAAVESLARAQAEQWTAEQTARRISDPYPLPVRWQVTPRARATMPTWASIRGAPGAGSVPLDGTYDRVADIFTHSDTPDRLVVLGDPGAGKSMLVLALTVELLRLRAATDAVPVLLPVAGWDPNQPLDDWIADRLAANNRPLARAVQASDGTRRSLARELVAAGRILPVLDGLDEMNPASHAAALAAIANAPAGGLRFVLTCRTAPYENAVIDGGPLPGTPVIELQPLRPAEVTRYLLDGTDQPQPRWDAVISELTGSAASPLTHALSTPLMVWLARAVYHHRATAPTQLLTAAWATTQSGIEQYLLDRLIPAVYTSATGGHPARTSTQADQAHHYLTYLAEHLNTRQTYNLAWWQLHKALHRPLAELAGGLATGLMVGLTVGLVAGLPVDLRLGLGFGFGLAFALAFGLVSGLGIRLQAGLVGGLLASLLAWLLTRLTVYPAHRILPVYPEDKIEDWLVAGLAAGAAAGLLAGFAAARSGKDTLRSAKLIRPTSSTLLAGLVAGLIPTLVAGLAPALIYTFTPEPFLDIFSLDSQPGLPSELVTGFVDGLDVGLPAGLVAGLAFVVTLSRTVDDGEKAITPSVLLADDRSATWMGGASLAVAFGFAFVLVGQVILAAEPEKLLVVGLAVGLMAGLSGVWWRFCLTRLLLAAAGLTPLRLMTFLSEAHERGILRQAGGVYQFRHSRLQDRLANPHP